MADAPAPALPEVKQQWPVRDKLLAAIAALLALAVVVGALNMKFQADQARWLQRQTCLDWYRLQASYGLGPWYDKLPLAAQDCGGDTDLDGTVLVPGGSEPAFRDSDLPTGVAPPARFDS